MPYRIILLALLAVSGLAAQPRIGYIEVYGVHRVPKARVLSALKAGPGDPLPRSKGATEDNLRALSGVVDAGVEVFCCDGDKTILYVGIQERGAPGFEYWPEPGADLQLPAEATAAYQEFTAALAQATKKGETAEDITRGYSLMADEDCRRIQLRIKDLAAENGPEVEKILRTAADPDQRAVAAYLLGYSSARREAAEALQYALRDPDAAVRLNAARALRPLAVYAADPQHKEERIIVRPTWFVEMLNSVALGDRLEGVRNLLDYTEQRDPNVLAHIRDKAVPALTEMANWKHLEHALPAFLVLGRAAGWTDEALQEAWRTGKREEIVAQLRKALSKK